VSLTLPDQLSNRARIARASAVVAPREAARSLIEFATWEVDLAIVLYDGIPSQELFTGDVLLLNKTIAPQKGDMIALLYAGGDTKVVSFAEYQIAPKKDLNTAAVLLGVCRTIGRA